MRGFYYKINPLTKLDKFSDTRGTNQIKLTTVMQANIYLQVGFKWCTANNSEEKTL